MAQSNNVSAGQDATAQQYNNLRADLFSAHHQDPAGVKIVNADIDNAAAIAFSKLAALTANRALATDGSGVIGVSAATAAELGYLAGIVSRPVSNSGDETINGIKTFGSIPVLPASNPTTDNQAARKRYIDDRVGAGAYACGVGTEYVNNTGPETVDQTVTVGFQPRIIKLYYFVQGYWGGMGIYGKKGLAIFNGTSIIVNIPFLGKLGASNQGTKLSTDNGNLSEDSYGLSFDPAVINSTSQIQGGASGANNGSWVVVTINSITSTGFVLRCVTSKDQYYTPTQRFKFFWEAYR